jgi:hypothetical protein
MQRRDILKFAASLTGSAIFSPLTISLLSSTQANAKTLISGASGANAPAFFETSTFRLITQIMDVVLPKTDTPSASDVNVHWIMDNMFNKVFKDGYRKRFLRNFAHLAQYLSEQNFEQVSAPQQLAIIKSIEAFEENQRDDVYRAYIDLKQQTISYYLATEEVAEQHLSYLPIPGQYTPCITVEEAGGKAWAG